jgi:hypothetical protein
MIRRSIFTLSAISALGLAMLPSSIVAQQGTLKQQLVGAWTLVSCLPTTLGPQCVNPNGIVMFDASGRYATVYAARGRPKVTTNRAETSAADYKAIAQGVVANFGTWSVNEADKTITRHLEGALFPSGEGRDAKSSVSLTGDELKLVSPEGESVYRRAK